MLTLILAALFNTITLQQFGAVENTNLPLQPEPDARFNVNQPLRTNDFQVLQQVDAQEMQAIRLGAFYISQSPTGVGITLPSAQAVSTKEVRTDLDQTRFIVGATEIIDTTGFVRVTNLFTSGLIPLVFPDAPTTQLPTPERITTQALWLIYFLPGDGTSTNLPENTRLDLLPNTMVDYNIIGNAYHDIRYNGLSPAIDLGGQEVVRLFYTDPAGNEFEVRPTGNEAIPLATGKLKFELANGQTWLFYVQESPMPLTLLLNPTKTGFTASQPFTGVLRIAAIQTTPPPATLPLNFFPTGDSWSTAIFNQTYPASPIGMYLFWPVEWIPRVASQIATNLAFLRDVPSCNLIPHLLPLLARADLPTAQLYFSELRPEQYDFTTNPFITQFLMLVASKQSAEIATYQATFRPQAQPIPFSAAQTEQTFDDNRASVPISAEVLFETNRVTWQYLLSKPGADPLIVYPAYKTLDGLAPATGFGYADPIKGPLNGVVASNGTLRFSEGAIPDFYEASFIPDTLQFTTPELRNLLNLFSPLTPSLDTSGVLNVGQQLSQLAMTVRLAIFTLEEAGYFGAIRERTEPFINLIRETLMAWLDPNVRANSDDFFIGDSLTGGIVTNLGVFGRGVAQGSLDESNALYSSHHIQYGHWLFAASTVIEWEERFRIPLQDRFITRPITFISTTYIMKDLIDMLWRDARNPDLDDPQLPYNRHGNPWEGHSTQNGILYTPIAEGRNQELFGQDFSSWVATTLYARAIRASTVLTTEQKAGFDTLEAFATTNTQLTATSGELICQDNLWVYPPPFSTANTTVGNVFDTQVLAETTLQRGTPCPIIPRTSPLVTN